MGIKKEAIFNRIEQAALLKAAEGDNEFVPIWLMLRLGIEPSQLGVKTLTVEDSVISWMRPKYLMPRREIVPKMILPKVKWWLERGRKRTRQGYDIVVSRVGERIGHPEYSYMTLWNTACVNQIRDSLSKGLSDDQTVQLVAEKFGTGLAPIQDNLKLYKEWVASGGQDVERQQLESSN